MVLIFPNLCLWRRSLRSNLGGIDPEKLYRATLGAVTLYDENCNHFSMAFVCLFVCLFFNITYFQRVLCPVQTDTTLLANNSYHSWMLHVASRLHTLLHAVAFCWKVLRKV